MFKQKSFRQRLNLESGEQDNFENNRDNDIKEETFNRAGAPILGRRMFDEGEFNWPEKSPLGTPVYVLTHRLREPWKRTGTTCYFINDKIESVLKEAKKAAGNKDVRISGGSATIQQYLNAGLVDQPTIPSAPLLPGKGFHLFENIDKGQVFPGNPGGHQFSTCNTSEILSRQQMKYEVGTSYFALLTLFHFRMIFIMPPPELFSPVLLRL